MKPLVNFSTATAWVIGHSSATVQLIHQLSPFNQALAFRKISRVAQLMPAMETDQAGRSQVIVVTTNKLDYDDLNTLRSLKTRRPDVPIAICFSSAHLGMVSYAWALDFAAYFTVDDSSFESHTLISSLLHGNPQAVLHSSVFCQWLRQYGILFENDLLPIQHDDNQ